MNSVELFHQDGRPSGVWYCSDCRAVLRNVDDLCCRERICACGKPTGSRYTSQCDACRKEADRLSDEKRLDAAEEIPSESYEDWVFVDGIGHKGGFFESLDELEEWLDENHDSEESGPLPEWAYACTSHPPQRVDISDVVEQMFTDSFEDADEQATGEDELAAALDAFWELNKSLVSWTPDYTKKVRVKTERPK